MTKLRSRKLHICPKMTKMGSIIGHRIDLQWGRCAERPAGHTDFLRSKKKIKMSKIIPIFKADDETDTSNYRAISS